MLQYLAIHMEDRNQFRLTKTSTPQTDVRSLSLISLQTVQQIASEFGREIDPRRFRANLYIDLPSGPFAEDSLTGKTLRIGAKARILIRERDPRCRIVAYDPDDPVEAEPHFALMKLLDFAHQGRAGVYATIQTPGPIRVGDVVSVEEEGNQDGERKVS